MLIAKASKLNAPKKAFDMLVKLWLAIQYRPFLVHESSEWTQLMNMMSTQRNVVRKELLFQQKWRTMSFLKTEALRAFPTEGKLAAMKLSQVQNVVISVQNDARYYDHDSY